MQSAIFLGEDVDAEAEEVLNELNLLTEHEESIIHVDRDTNEWSKCIIMKKFFKSIVITLFSIKLLYVKIQYIEECNQTQGVPAKKVDRHWAWGN